MKNMTLCIKHKYKQVTWRDLTSSCFTVSFNASPQTFGLNREILVIGGRVSIPVMVMPNHMGLYKQSSLVGVESV